MSIMEGIGRGGTMRRFCSGMVALALGLVLAGCGSKTIVMADGQQTNVITVSASSEVKVVPDKASLTLEVLAQGKTAQEAQTASVGPVDAVLAAIKEAGIPEKDVQTTYAGISPIYDWSGEAERITGYESRTTLQVSGVDVDDVASLMEACVAAGATGINGPSYYASTYDEAYGQALSEAVAASRGKAEAIAKAAGVTLGDVVAVTEGYQNTALRYEEAASNMAMADGADMKIAPGEVSIEAQVTVSYDIG